jgi:hypothetical protein
MLAIIAFNIIRLIKICSGYSNVGVGGGRALATELLWAVRNHCSNHNLDLLPSLVTWSPKPEGLSTCACIESFSPHLQTHNAMEI